MCHTLLNWISHLSSSDKIALFSAISSLFLATVALWQSHKSIKLTEKSILEANRPVIVAYVDIVNVDTIDKFLIIKNFGQTTALITKIEVKDLNVMLNLSSRLEAITNVSFAPNQKIVTELIPTDGLNGKIEPFKITLHYKDLSEKKYVETFSLNLAFTSAIVTARQSSSSISASDKNLNEIASALIKELK